ncbi:DUF4177 domain-containing protein [Pontimicrobium aquaticum]|uniref:DUF4177 domain-containing protein n=1 Tax=Pontimicrobium aquaticum TaxID=2565367 RepID=A0A4U0EWW5_9FLAO|nr:DUF4177 domain-containing protein [Pontimicrobium aquaticum]TJY36350.1 DUF4177 domain-containing protein [Pontimicrobium aquaticum]
MKEYKVVSVKLGFKNRNQKLEDTLNQYAREGWVVSHVAQSAYFIVFERNKNR